MERSAALETKPIGRLIATMSLPAILSMLVQALYNIVDTAFISRFDSTAVESLSLAYPLQMLQLAFALGISIGTNSIIARKLGAKNSTGACKSFSTGFLMSIITSFIFVISGIFIPRLYISLFTSDSVVIGYGVEYLTIIMLFCTPLYIENTCAKSIQGSGNMIIPMVAQLIGAILNILLDYLFIFVFNMGVPGAAFATVLAQSCALLFVLYNIFFRNLELKLSFKGFRFVKEEVYEILRVGIPVAIINAVGSITIFCMNFILSVYQNAVSALSLYFKVQSFVFMPVFGLNQGITPIMGYNYGANNKKRFVKTYRLANIIAISIMLSGLLVFQFLSEAIIPSLFDVTPELVTVATTAFKTISFCFPFAAIGIVASAMFQSIGHGTKSLTMSFSRQVFILLPIAFALSNLYGLNSVWYCYLIAEAVSALVFFPIALIVIRNVFKEKEIFTNICESTI